MSCGWTSDHVIREVGDAQFPPDPQNVPASETAPRAEAEAAAADAADLEVPGPGGDEPYTIFLVEQKSYSCCCVFFGSYNKAVLRFAGTRCLNTKDHGCSGSLYTREPPIV